MIRIKAVTLTQETKLLITEAHTVCFPNDERYCPEKGHWWIAYDGDRLAGFAGIRRSNRWSDAGYLCRAAVMPEFRGCGLQKRLIRVRIAKARSLGWRYCITDTRLNPKSANSLISCGFRMYLPRVPWSFRDACYWRLNLQVKPNV